MSDPKFKRKREPRPATAYVIADGITAEQLGEPREWLQTHNLTDNIGARFLLAHAEDGVIWGRFDDSVLTTSFDASQDAKYDTEYIKGWGRADLRQVTLWQARIFGETAELFLWRDGDGLFHARTIYEAGAPTAQSKPIAEYQEAFDEPQILWGTDVKPLDHNFTLMIDGAQGMRHAVPLAITGEFEEKARPLRLVVRHYVKQESDGFNRIAISRLVRVEVAK